MTVKGISRGKESFDEFIIDLRPLGLKVRALILVKTEPFHRFNNGIYSLFCRPSPISVFYPEYKFSIIAPGEDPVEKGCSGPANMEGACWAGRESGDDLSFIHRV
jgi:hypothetical protein